MSATPFLTTFAVETWDTWFRWREHGRLRDTTVELTWERVADALARDVRRTGYQERLLDAFSSWRLLLDERVLASAGTGRVAWRGDDLCAVLNVAAFVRAPGLAHASFDTAALEETATLAVHALDDAAALAPDAATARLRIGLAGVADALALLGLRYDSVEGRVRATAFARHLACGCLAGSIALARNRAPRMQSDAHWRRHADERGTPAELLGAAARHGLRYGALTAITSQRRLACLANSIADAVDPLGTLDCDEPCGRGERRGAVPHDGFARLIARQSGTDLRSLQPSAAALIPAQLTLRSALQPWIDAPIAYPLCVDNLPTAPDVAQWSQLASELELPEPSWRLTRIPCNTVRGETAGTSSFARSGSAHSTKST